MYNRVVGQGQQSQKSLPMLEKLCDRLLWDCLKNDELRISCNGLERSTKTIQQLTGVGPLPTAILLTSFSVLSANPDLL